MVHQIICLFLLFRRVYSELHKEHQFARVAGSNHQGTKQAMILSEIIKFKPMLKGILTNVITDLIVDIVHQMTLCNIENLVKCSCDVEAHGIHDIITDILLHFFLRQPTFVGKAKLKLIAIAIDFLATKNRHEFRQFNLSNSSEIIINLLLLGT